MKQIKKLSLYFISLTLLLFCGVTAVKAQNPQQIAKKALDSTVLLIMEDANGQPLTLGSGFFVRNNQVATNLHVVKGASRGYAKLVGQQTKYDIEGITAVDAERDLVILKISVPGAQVIPLGDSDTVQVGASIYAVGNPRGLEGTFSQGIISSIRKVGVDKILQLTAAISPGSSGGPVLNDKGEVIGVSVATFRSGQNLNFAIPSNYLKKLMKQIGFVRPLPKEKPIGSKSSIFADLGGKGTKGVTGGKVIFSFDSYYSIHNPISFSLRNHLRQDVKNVHYYIIFYDKLGDPIDVGIQEYSKIIPAGLAKRVSCGGAYDDVSISSDVARMVKDGGKIEFRILDFEIVE